MWCANFRLCALCLRIWEAGFLPDRKSDNDFQFCQKYIGVPTSRVAVLIIIKSRGYISFFKIIFYVTTETGASQQSFAA